MAGDKELIEVVSKAIALACSDHEANRHHYALAAEKAIEARDAYLEKNGLVVVPAEPTEAMVKAGCVTWDTDGGVAYDIYEAMIAAAQKE